MGCDGGVEGVTQVGRRSCHLHADAAEAEGLLVDVAADVALDKGGEVVEVAVVAAPLREILVEGRAELPDEREREQRGEAEEDDREREEDERRHAVGHERHRLHRHRRRAVRRRRGEQQPEQQEQREDGGSPHRFAEDFVLVGRRLGRPPQRGVGGQPLEEDEEVAAAAEGEEGEAEPRAVDGEDEEEGDEEVARQHVGDLQW